VTPYRCSSEDRRKPLYALSALAEHAGGLICLTGAVPFGLLSRLVLAGRQERTKEVLGLLWEAFGVGNVFVELTDDRTGPGAPVLLAPGEPYPALRGPRRRGG